MNNQNLEQLPGQKLRSGALGRLGLVLCLVSLATLGLMALLKPG